MFQIQSGSAVPMKSAMSDIPGLIRASNTDREVSVGVTTKEVSQMNAANYRMAPVYTPGGGYSCAQLNGMGARPSSQLASSACVPSFSSDAIASIRGVEWNAMRSGVRRDDVRSYSAESAAAIVSARATTTLMGAPASASGAFAAGGLAAASSCSSTDMGATQCALQFAAPSSSAAASVAASNAFYSPLQGAASSSAARAAPYSCSSFGSGTACSFSKQ